MSQLCTQIERALERGENAEGSIARWHEHATGIYEPHEFSHYWSSIDQDQFVRQALNPLPTLVDDLTYREVRDVFECVCKAEVPPHEHSYFRKWLATQFPGANISDLIYWPDEWFGDPALFRNEDGTFKPEAELSVDQMLAYAMAKSGRHLADAPRDVPLPFPMPTA